MKISAIITSRNDNYGGNLNERATYCFNSAIDTYDEVIYIDWNSDTHSLLYDIKDNIQFKGNFKHIVIPPYAATNLTNKDPDAQKCCEVLARNIGLRRATGDWLISTNIDIIHPKRESLIESINTMSDSIFYSVMRRGIDWEDILNYNNGDYNFLNWKNTKDFLDNEKEEHFVKDILNTHFGGKKIKSFENNNFDLFPCCGDFQIAHKKVWSEIKGFEEKFIYPLYTDTNVQKKSILHGFGLEGRYEPALYHINHGKGGGGLLDNINKVSNDFYEAILSNQKTENLDTWGFSDIEIEYEVF